MNPRRPYLMFLVIIIALTMIALFAAMYVDITHDDTEPPATSTNPAAVHKPYAVPVTCPTGAPLCAYSTMPVRLRVSGPLRLCLPRRRGNDRAA